MRVYMLSFIIALISIDPVTEEIIVSSCIDSTDSYALTIEDLSGNDITGQVLDIQTTYKLIIDMNHANCFNNVAYQITSHWGMTMTALAKDASCGDVEFTFTLGGVAAKGTMSWSIEVTPFGKDSVTGDYCLASHHAKTISGTAN